MRIGPQTMESIEGVGRRRQAEGLCMRDTSPRNSGVTQHICGIATRTEVVTQQLLLQFIQLDIDFINTSDDGLSEMMIYAVVMYYMRHHAFHPK